MSGVTPETTESRFSRWWSVGCAVFAANALGFGIFYLVAGQYALTFLYGSLTFAWGGVPVHAPAVHSLGYSRGPLRDDEQRHRGETARHGPAGVWITAEIERDLAAMKL